MGYKTNSKHTKSTLPIPDRVLLLVRINFPREVSLPGDFFRHGDRQGAELRRCRKKHGHDNIFRKPYAAS